jgi:hypothetical protein
MIRKIFQLLTRLPGNIHNAWKHIRPISNKTLLSIKQSAMKSRNIQQEILVFTQTSFVKKALMETVCNNVKSYAAEQLEEAFWNGMLNKMLPELVTPRQQRGAEVFIWQIWSGESSVLIDMAEDPDVIEHAYSICSLLFLPTANMN